MRIVLCADGRAKDCEPFRSARNQRAKRERIASAKISAVPPNRISKDRFANRQISGQRGLSRVAGSIADDVKCVTSR
jgi:hypothetical protein